MIETIIMAAIAIANIAAAIYTIFLSFVEIRNWWISNRRLSQNDRREIAFTLQRRLANGDFNTVQGVFNKSTSTMGSIRQVNSGKIDAELAAHHRTNDLVVYE